MAKNSSTKAQKPRVMCVHPISGQYGLLPRLLYYLLLIFGTTMRKRSWLVGGAFASVMTFSGAATVHALVLAGTSAHSLYDLDTVAIWAIVSAGLLAMEPVMELSGTLRGSQYRRVIGWWTTLVAFGAGLSLVALMLRHYPTEAECRSSSGQMLQRPAQTLDPGFNCTYECFLTSQVFRTSNAIEVVALDRIGRGPQNPFHIASAVMVWVGGSFVGLFGFCLIGRQRTVSELEKQIESLSQEPLNEDFEARCDRRIKLDNLRKELETGKYSETATFAYINPLLFVIVVIVNEYYILANPSLPTSEGLYEVGQWSPFVNVGLVLVAAAINKHYEPKWKARQELIAKERAAFELRKKGGNPSAPVDADQDTAVEGVQASQIPGEDVEPIQATVEATVEQRDDTIYENQADQEQTLPQMDRQAEAETGTSCSVDTIRSVQRQNTVNLERGL